MPFRITNPDLFPPIYLGYIDPDDYYSYSGILQQDGSMRLYANIEELIAHIEQRRDALAYKEIKHLREKIEEYIYRLDIAPKSLFSRYSPEASSSNPPPRFLLNDIITAAKIAKELSKAAISGQTLPGSAGWVTRTEANKRAATCVQCPLNQDTSKASLYRRTANKLAALFTSLRETDYDKKLLDCAVCTCPLVAKVHYSNEVIREVSTQRPEDFPESFVGHDKQNHQCWMHPLLKHPQYRSGE